MKGRKPKPTALKILHGDKDKNRINKDEPPASPDEPVCPPHLGDVARTQWEFTLGLLREMNLATKTDTTALEMYCLAYAEYRKLEEQIAVAGPTLISRGADGKTEIQRNPMTTARNAARDACLKMMADFGLTPAARTRIHAPTKQESTIQLFARKRG